jgi:hypothetical protein
MNTTIPTRIGRSWALFRETLLRSPGLTLYERKQFVVRLVTSYGSSP